MTFILKKECIYVHNAIMFDQLLPYTLLQSVCQILTETVSDDYMINGAEGTILDLYYYSLYLS